MVISDLNQIGLRKLLFIDRVGSLRSRRFSWSFSNDLMINAALVTAIIGDLLRRLWLIKLYRVVRAQDHKHRRWEIFLLAKVCIRFQSMQDPVWALELFSRSLRQQKHVEVDGDLAFVTR